MPPPGGSTGSRWDISILEKNLLGGLDHIDQQYVASKLFPELVTAARP